MTIFGMMNKHPCYKCAIFVISNDYHFAIKRLSLIAYRYHLDSRLILSGGVPGEFPWQDAFVIQMRILPLQSNVFSQETKRKQGKVIKQLSGISKKYQKDNAKLSRKKRQPGKRGINRYGSRKKEKGAKGKMRISLYGS